ncbi:hypothetical protein PV04_03566 [Phialophora macrospora]|uniref:Zn(2)-C6 fungal-type domain-containing protein n=1 Tax=Phialophora macrospora TaxID=1851006 RepID=A0A0D2EAR1_9EURO|nr:hypothetical protein PV04_03566 [Phialophora macrospora]
MDPDMNADSGQPAPGFSDSYERPPSKRARTGKRGRKQTSCTQCHLRKQACDKNQPCNRCVQRGVAHLCSTSSKGFSGEADSAPNEVNNVATRRPSDDKEQASPRNRATPASPKLGELFVARGARSFYGTSYFGHQVAARILQEESPDLPSGISRGRDSLRSFRDESSPFSQVWDLLGLLPRQKSAVDRLVDKFLAEVNWCLDAVHERTFRNQYNEFWARRFGFDDLAGVDLRWLALLFIILAFSCLIDAPPNCTKEMQRDCEETSLRFYWASRRAIVIAPSFYGESTDIVRAGLLVTRYLLHTRRLTESWLTISFNMRMAQAQGMHVDGEKWGLSRKTIGQHRRIWSHIYALDRMIALALGRPYAINDNLCLFNEAENIWLDDMDSDDAARAVPQPMELPTPSVLSFLTHRLAKIVGTIQERCFGLASASYDVVLALDRELLSWSERLPAYFRLDFPDLSSDATLPFLKWHRLNLHTSFHFARIMLHRPYLLRESITNRFRPSHEACMSSASADLKIRFDVLTYTAAENLRWALGAHNLFNSAMILGIIAVRNPYSDMTSGILEDLEAYCERLNRDVWLNEVVMAEVKVVELCISKVKGKRRGPTRRPITPLPRPMSVTDDAVGVEGPFPVDSSTSGISPDLGSVYWPAVWEDNQFSFPEVADLDVWEQMISGIAPSLT